MIVLIQVGHERQTQRERQRADDGSLEKGSIEKTTKKELPKGREKIPARACYQRW